MKVIDNLVLKYGLNFLSAYTVEFFFLFNYNRNNRLRYLFFSYEIFYHVIYLSYFNEVLGTFAEVPTPNTPFNTIVKFSLSFFTNTSRFVDLRVLKIFFLS